MNKYLVKLDGTSRKEVSANSVVLENGMVIFKSKESEVEALFPVGRIIYMEKIEADQENNEMKEIPEMESVKKPTKPKTEKAEKAD